MNLTPPAHSGIVAAHFKADFSWTLAYWSNGQWIDASDNRPIKSEIVGWTETKDARLARAERIASVELRRLQDEQRRAA